ncbi:hypothetical protein K493DRAFT_314140 [Basidiobolus meristosporus CBS 931.73]|uniref:Branched-chain-amino-acid aminotransferase-like protein 2 n=1 Tax=Basidiobolus meristosporus CBS 931.73 TaxID=1314790 RepID=A0A1Y1YH32_9FUNG|nr:hypothetical protein K493DRAFT_314140 [Basidiobolus meristosporus CBS 931.73]|eukprot:ORX97258.1 hypothetical protein K493DRAFT_314140 [Basidiobolus meristosporus CBS 931.73]
MIPTESRRDLPIMLWCHPRSVSSAFERAFIQRDKEFHCLHEPFIDAYYHGPDRASDRHHESLSSPATDQENNSPQPSYQDVTEQIMSSYWLDPTVGDIVDKETSGAHKLRVFVKDMAFYGILKAPDEQGEVEARFPLHRVINTFLIRDPRKSVVSFYKASLNEETNWGYFDPKEMGYQDLRTLFDYVTTRLKQPAIVVDADELCSDPGNIMKAFCECVDVRFEESMIHWEPTKVKQFERWKGWHDVVENSSGLGQVEATPMPDLREYPEIVLETINQSLPHYNYLKQFSIQSKIKVSSS